MRVCHDVTAVFDDPNLVSCAGLAPVLQLASITGAEDGLSRSVRCRVRGGRPGTGGRGVCGASRDGGAIIA